MHICICTELQKAFNLRPGKFANLPQISKCCKVGLSKLKIGMKLDQ